MGRWTRLSLLLGTCSFIQGNDFPLLIVAGASSQDTDLDGSTSVFLRLIPILSVTGALQQQTCLCIDSIWWICINEFASNLIRRTIDTPQSLPLSRTSELLPQSDTWCWGEPVCKTGDCYANDYHVCSCFVSICYLGTHYLSGVLS